MKKLIAALFLMSGMSAFSQESGRFISRTSTRLLSYETANFDSIRLLAATKDQTDNSRARQVELILGRARALCAVNGLELAAEPTVKEASGGSKFLAIVDGAPEIINDGSYRSVGGKVLKTIYFESVDCMPRQF